MDWALLEQIHALHESMAGDLRSAGDYVIRRLQNVSSVHSLKMRIKNPDHLIEKIIRKKLKSTELNFDCDSYKGLVTDLIGIRALHLFKGEWKEINEFVRATWDLHEDALAYVRDGDRDEEFRKADFRVEKHPLGYRSIHYVLKTQPSKTVHLVELQVRTIFEEGWSEIDHRVRYPRFSENPYLGAYLATFNRIAGAADEMGTFTEMLSTLIGEHERIIQQKEGELRDAISVLQISKAEKEQLERKLAELSRSSPLSTAGSLNIVGLTTSSLIVGDMMKKKKCSRCGRDFMVFLLVRPCRAELMNVVPVEVVAQF